MKKANYYSISEIIKDIWSRDKSELISQRQLCLSYDVTESQIRSLMKKMVTFGFIYSRGRIGYSQNEDLITIIRKSKLKKEIDFIENEITFKSKYLVLNFTLFEFIEIISSWNFNLKREYKIEELFTILIAMNNKYSIYGRKDICYDLKTNTYNVSIVYYKSTTNKIIHTFKYKSYEKILKEYI